MGIMSVKSMQLICLSRLMLLNASIHVNRRKNRQGEMKVAYQRCYVVTFTQISFVKPYEYIFEHH